MKSRTGPGNVFNRHLRIDSLVGRLIAAASAKTLKRMNLELGGKTPMIVCLTTRRSPPLSRFWPPVLRPLLARTAWRALGSSFSAASPIRCAST